MLRTFTTTSLAALVAATFSASVLAQPQTEQQSQTYDREQRQMDEQRNYERGSEHADKKIVEVLDEKERFSKFRKALKQADMKDKLNSDDSYTVFAPTNEAFERLPQGTWDSWMEDDNKDELRDVLSYHIVEERLTTDDLDDSRASKETLNGGELQVAHSFGSFTVNTASVTVANIEAENGYIHAIDSVLMDNQRATGYTSTED